MQSVAYHDMLIELSNLSLSSVPNDKQDMFFSWVTTHSDFLQKEQQPFTVSQAFIPRDLSENDYNFYHKYIPTELEVCYHKVGSHYVLIGQTISDIDATKIYCSINLVKRNVVWVDFGFNVGYEFGGKHPAIILHNVGNKTLIVAPISSNSTSRVANAETILFSSSDFCGLPSLRDRFTIVNRITPISVYRVDLASPVAKLRNQNKFQEILSKFKNYLV